MKAYVLFHLNTDYSSISVSQLPSVISSCYEEILNLQDSLSIPLALEMTGSTAQTILELRPGLIERIRERIAEHKLAIISGGMHQIIGPLVPPEVTLRNHQRGIDLLGQIFGSAPEIVLPSEQAISEGSLAVLAKADYRAIIADIDNFGTSYEDNLSNSSADVTKIVWASSSIYQWVQHYVHGDISLEEILSRIEARMTLYESNCPFPLYSGDAETFGFRPGRYLSEGQIKVREEWTRFAQLIETLRDNHNFVFTSKLGPQSGQVDDKNGLKNPSLPWEPIRVKKQPKYNVSRWAVSGRGDFELNAYCRHKFEELITSEKTTLEDWNRLLRYWSSDFRTHITDERWAELMQEIGLDSHPSVHLVSQIGSPSRPLPPEVVDQSRFVKISTADFDVTIDKNRGLAISRVVRHGSDTSIFGTVPHGTFLRTDLSPDWYSGNLTLQIPGQQQITDLSRCEAKISLDGSKVNIGTSMPFSNGLLQKVLTIDLLSSEICVSYHLPRLVRNGSLRLGYLSMLRPSDDNLALTYTTHNGGFFAERYEVTKEEFDMGASVNHLVSARTGIGMTGGWIHFRRHDISEQLLLRYNPSSNPFLGLLSNYSSREGTLTKFCLSAMERDETLKPEGFLTARLEYSILPGADTPSK